MHSDNVANIKGRFTIHTVAYW